MKLPLLAGAGLYLVMSAFILKKENGGAQPFYETKWLLKKIYTDSGVRVPGPKAYIRFHDEKKSAGGNGGCNVFGSTITVKGGSIIFSDIVSTKMYCEGTQESEDAYFQELDRVNRFVLTEHRLLLFQDGQLRLEFETD